MGFRYYPMVYTPIMKETSIIVHPLLSYVSWKYMCLTMEPL